MEIKSVDIKKLIPYARNPRKNDQAVDSVAASLKEFGWKQPIVVDREMVVVAGHTRLKAAQKLGITEVPIVIADDLTPAQVKAYRVLDNKIAEKSDWDSELLAIELEEISIDLEEFDVSFDDHFPAGPEANDKNLDESLADDVDTVRCPECGHTFPK